MLARNGGKIGKELRAAARKKAMAEREAADVVEESGRQSPYSPIQSTRVMKGALDAKQGIEETPSLPSSSSMSPQNAAGSLDDLEREMMEATLSTSGDQYESTGGQYDSTGDYAKSAYGGNPNPRGSGLRTGRRSVVSISKVDRIVRENSRKQATSSLLAQVTSGLPKARRNSRSSSPTRSPISNRRVTQKPRKRNLYASQSYHV